MWIFIWDNAPSKIFVGDSEVSKVFVWDTKVRPNYYEYSYDFRNKSSTILTNDGWDIFYNPSQLNFNSYWIIPTTTNTSVMLKIVKSWICSNAKKATFSVTWTLIAAEWYRLSLYNVATSSTRSWVSWPFFNSTTTQTTIYSSNVSTAETNSWQITMTTVFDLENWTWSTTQTDGYSNSWTLTATQISNIKNNSNWFYVSTWSSYLTPQWWLATIYVKVE